MGYLLSMNRDVRVSGWVTSYITNNQMWYTFSESSPSTLHKIQSKPDPLVLDWSVHSNTLWYWMTRGLGKVRTHVDFQPTP